MIYNNFESFEFWEYFSYPAANESSTRHSIGSLLSSIVAAFLFTTFLHSYLSLVSLILSSFPSLLCLFNLFSRHWWSFSFSFNLRCKTATIKFVLPCLVICPTRLNFLFLILRVAALIRQVHAGLCHLFCFQSIWFSAACGRTAFRCLQSVQILMFQGPSFASEYYCFSHMRFFICSASGLWVMSLSVHIM